MHISAKRTVDDYVRQAILQHGTDVVEMKRMKTDRKVLSIASMFAELHGAEKTCQNVSSL